MQRLIEDDIKKLFYSDVAGVKPTTACICSDKELAESKFLLHAKTTTSITKEGRIKVFMPWRDGYPEALPFNKEKTVARMYQQENSLRRNGRLEAYNAEIRNLITQGFVRPLTIEEDSRRAWLVSGASRRLSRRQVHHEDPHRLERRRTVQGRFTQRRLSPKAPTCSTHSSHVFSLGVAIESHSWET